ncbi:MAG: alpha-hydroxy-acid oxidizing protein [Acidobacteria bacterium]|nr:alpha-hydroxy-acid oxidizing protein [Acidobacteriota bacterium]
MTVHRRNFLRFLAASPLTGLAQDALNVFDLEEAARAKLPPAHFGYLATGVEGDATLNANREAFARYPLRPRRLIDVTKVSTEVELFGQRFASPVLLAPTGSNKAFHEEGELAVARAAASRKSCQILSTAATTSLETVNEAFGAPVWFQLYPTSNWSITEKLVRRAEKAGTKILVVTVDIPAGRKTETELRFKKKDTRDCAGCHGAGPIGTADYFIRKPMFEGIEMKGESLFAPAFTWATLQRLRGMTPMKIVLKGIVTREDATLARQSNVDGIIVSNHGGRAEESGKASLDCLSEVLSAAGPGIAVLMDGGVRRGGDIFKALALGAKAVCIGRPYLWGLGAYGQRGVEMAIDILRGELELVMKQCGTRALSEIKRSHID